MFMTQEVEWGARSVRERELQVEGATVYFRSKIFKMGGLGKMGGR